jgi:hypothetical protein
MPYPYEIPVLSSFEIQQVRKTLENRLTDTCFIYNSIGFLNKVYGRCGVAVWDGDSTRDSIKEVINEYYYAYGSASWGDAVSCRVTSTGTESKLDSNDTVFTTNIQVQLPISVAVSPVTEQRQQPYADAVAVYESSVMLGTWIAYGSRVWRVTGINVSDSVPTIQTVTAELDYANDDTEYTVSTGITAYATVGDALVANIGSLPVYGKRIITDAGLVLGTVSGKYFVTKG